VIPPPTSCVRIFCRFPDGMKALGDYIHGKGLSFAIYSAESSETCGGYPASQGSESLGCDQRSRPGVSVRCATHKSRCSVFDILRLVALLQITSRSTDAAVSRAGECIDLPAPKLNCRLPCR